MPKYIAFLRAINVGGHTVNMDRLRQLFESLGFAKVETFIASGNVVFETSSQNAPALERKIEKTLQDALGYEVVTFIRTVAELEQIANYKPFPKAQLDHGMALNIALLAEPLDAPSKQRALAFKTDVDSFHVHGREVYWLCLKRQSESTFSNVLFEKALGKRTTFRGANTLKKLAEKLKEI
jgi:uncharacterized protein (DUF1697 family)